MKHLTTFRMIDAIERTGSIRSAAEQVAQTPSAVQRRLQSYEEELGFEIFDRSTKGVQPSAAGELVIHHVRESLAENERLHSRLADLAGLRRGHVSIGCSQALVPYFLPQEISTYQAEFPNVTFDVTVLEHSRAADALENFAVDIVLVFNEQEAPAYDVWLAVPQQLIAIMSQHHPLAENEMVLLRECYEYPVLLAQRGFGGRELLDRSLVGKTFAKPPHVQSNSFEFLAAHVAVTDAITFQIQIGAPSSSADSATVSRVVNPKDVVEGLLLLGQKRNRALPVAVSRFVEQITKSLSLQFDVTDNAKH